MKKVIILAAVASLVVLASCKKKGVCTCTNIASGKKTVYSYEDMTAYEKKGMKSDCDSDAKVTVTYDGTTLPAEEETSTCEWSKK